MTGLVPKQVVIQLPYLKTAATSKFTFLKSHMDICFFTVERRRRFNINDRIKELGTLLPNSIDP